MRNSDYASRRHDGSLRAELRKLDIDDSGPRRVEGSPGHVGERSHRGSTASTTASAVPPRLSATLVASTESSRRRAVPPPPSSAGEAPRRRDSSQKQLASTLGLPSIMPNSGTSSHHRGDSSSSIRRRSADEQRGDSAYGSRGGREERGSSETGPRQARGLRPRTRKIRPMRLAGDRSRATPRRAHRAGTVGDLWSTRGCTSRGSALRRYGARRRAGWITTGTTTTAVTT